MSLRKLNPIFLTAILAISAFTGCKKEDDAATLPYLNGILKVSVPEYARTGETVTLSPKGLEHPDGQEIGYRWKVTPTMTKYDTIETFTFTYTDTLQTCSVHCYGFAEGYNSSSASYKTVVVNGGPDGSIQGLGITESTPYVEHNGIKYHYTTVGDRQWFINNLADTDAGGAPYKNYEAMSDVFGRYYSYEEAINACPSGWSLPSEEDWMALMTGIGAAPSEKYQNFKGVASKIMADADFNGNRMWEYYPAVGQITNSSGLALIPTGYSNLGTKKENGYTYAEFSGVNEFAMVWTADRDNDESGMAYYRYIIEDQPDMYIGKGDTKSFGAAVRCVRLKP